MFAANDVPRKSSEDWWPLHCFWRNLALQHEATAMPEILLEGA